MDCTPILFSWMEIALERAALLTSIFYNSRRKDIEARENVTAC